MKSAVLFYNDGQVKFTHRVVGPHTWLYREEYINQAPIPVEAPLDEHAMATLEYRSFSKIGESSHYVLYGESR